MIALNAQDLSMKEFNIIQATTLLMLAVMTDLDALGEPAAPKALGCPFSEAAASFSVYGLFPHQGVEKVGRLPCRSIRRGTS
jgi:hypothetical protein